MSNRREIPGFYFDEERNRYFAIPPSGMVAEFNTPEIRKLDTNVQNKRRKLQDAYNHSKISDAENVKIQKKAEQDKHYEKLEKLYLRSLESMYTSNTAMFLLNREWNTINSERTFQRIQLKITVFLGSDIGGFITGVKLVRYLAEEEKDIYSLVFYSGDVDSFNIAYEKRSPKFLRNDESVCNDRPGYSPITNLVPAIRLELPRYTAGFNSCLKYDYASYLSDLGSTLKFVLSENICCKYESSCYVIHFEEQDRVIKVKSEITSMYYLDGIVAYGCRNGNVSIILKDKTTIDFNISSPVCSLILKMADRRLFCVISSTNNQLTSYLLDITNHNAILHLYYYDYHWGWKLSNNMKNDEECGNIFCVESETSDPSKLEIKVYSILCAKPLIMSSGPYEIVNSDKSELSWLVAHKNLGIFSKQSQELKLYQYMK